MRRALAFPLILLVASCAGTATERVWLRPGTPALAAEQDFLSCAAQARRDFPAERRLDVGPRVSVGIGVGRCRGNLCYGVSNAAPILRERDASADLRERAVDACMLSKGYGERALPRCTATAAVLPSQPFDTRGLCAADGRVAAPTPR